MENDAEEPEEEVMQVWRWTVTLPAACQNYPSPIILPSAPHPKAPSIIIIPRNGRRNILVDHYCIANSHSPSHLSLEVLTFTYIQRKMQFVLIYTTNDFMKLSRASFARFDNIK